MELIEKNYLMPPDNATIPVLALPNFDTPNKISMHKQQKRVLNHL